MHEVFLALNLRNVGIDYFMKRESKHQEEQKKKENLSFVLSTIYTMKIFYILLITLISASYMS